MWDCEAVEHVEHVELVEPCIICFEEFDDGGAAPLCSSDIVVTRHCACNYMVHRTCWNRWRKQLLSRRRGLRCLVCSSAVERRRSRGETIAEFIETHEVQSVRACRYIVYLVCIAILFIVVCGLYN